ncbi:MAG: PH domain-containing protein [Patescibacteria group bacterium]
MAKLPLEPGEKILMTFRRHWIVYFLDALVLFILFLLPYTIFRLLGLGGSEGIITNSSLHLATFFYTAWFILLWAYFFIVWTNAYLDAWIVTDRRIIDIEQQSLFHRTVSDFRIEKIQNIMVKEKGLIANMFGYGTIVVETAGERIILEFDTIPHPYKVRDLISECHDKCLAKLSQNGIGGQIRDIITEG